MILKPKNQYNNTKKTHLIQSILNSFFQIKQRYFLLN